MNKQKYVDLHNHTVYSDGLDSPGSIVRNTRMKGIDIVAITDHDTLAGYEEAKEEARIWNIKLIPGVEVSTEIYHILGLNINPNDMEFREFLGKIQQNQKDLCRRRIEVLKNYGVPISLKKLEGFFPKSRLGKYNVFMAMLMDKECNEYLQKKHENMTPDEMFSFYLRSGGIAGKLEGKNDMTSKQAIDAIHRAGGIAIVAHPFKEIKNDIESNLDKLVKEGLDGLEVQPFYGEKNDRFKEYAEKNGLLISYGSDFHGVSFYRTSLGRNGNVASERLLEKLKERPEEHIKLPEPRWSKNFKEYKGKTGEEFFE